MLSTKLLLETHTIWTFIKMISIPDEATKRLSGTPLHTLSKVYHVPFGFGPPRLSKCLALFAVAKRLLLLDIGWFVLLLDLCKSRLSNGDTFTSHFEYAREWRNGATFGREVSYVEVKIVTFIIRWLFQMAVNVEIYEYIKVTALSCLVDLRVNEDEGYC